MWVFMLKGKGEAFAAFVKFKAAIQKECEYVVKAPRTDRGDKFKGV